MNFAGEGKVRLKRVRAPTEPLEIYDYRRPLLLRLFLDDEDESETGRITGIE